MASVVVHVCPICAKVAKPRSANSSFPFCSPPCKLVDLGNWLDGAYRVPGSADEPNDSASPRDGSDVDEVHEPQSE